MIYFASSALTKNAFERCQRRLNFFKSKAFLVHRRLDFRTKHCSRSLWAFLRFHMLLSMNLTLSRSPSVSLSPCPML